MPGDGDPEADDTHVRRVQGVAARRLRRRLGRHHVAGRGRRARRSGLAAADLQRGAVALQRRRSACSRSASPWPARRSSRGALPSSRSGSCPRCCAATTCGASCSPSPARAPTSRACGRAPSATATSGRQRPEGVDVGRALQRLGPPARAQRSRRAEAQGHHRVPARHAHARHRRAAAAPDHRRVALQRGVPHRRPHPRRDAPRSARTAVGAPRTRCSRTSGR